MVKKYWFQSRVSTLVNNMTTPIKVCKKANSNPEEDKKVANNTIIKWVNKASHLS